jgi:hypothetical protein
LSGEEEGWPKILLKSSPKGKMKGVRKQNVVLKYVARTGKGMNMTEIKKESALSMWVLLITIMVGVIILGRFIFFRIRRLS